MIKFRDLWKTFFDTPEEWHAFIVGLLESIHFRHPASKPSYSKTVYLDTEYHYYMFGRTCGFILLLCLISFIVHLFIGG